MKKTALRAMALCLMALPAFWGCRTTNLNVEWQAEAVFSNPECVVYDPAENVLFVSNINGSPAKHDGNGFISKLDTNGKIVDLKWAEGLDAPKGMGISSGLLYVTDICKVVVIDLHTGDIVKTVHINGAKFLNDIVVINENRFIVSDTRANGIFIVESGCATKSEHRLKNANGLYFDQSHLYIGANRKVYRYDLEAKTLECVLENPGNVDGLVKTAEDTFYCSNYFNKLVRYENGESALLLKGIPFADCVADFCMIGDNIIVPDLAKTVTMFSKPQ